MNKADLQRAMKATGTSALAGVVVMFGDQLVQIDSVTKLGDRVVIKVAQNPMDETPEQIELPD